MIPIRALAFLAGGMGWAAAHPLCYVNDKPVDVDEVLTFCPETQFGACCTDMEELEVEGWYNAVGPLTGDCADLYKEVVCGICHSFSGHLYERLTGELGIVDGMTMKREFCEEVVDACEGQIPFPIYENGDDYCEKHVGGEVDKFWSYPYTEDIFSAGLTKVFPDLDNVSDFPGKTISIRQSPDGSMYWLMGQLGEVKKVDADDLDSISTVVDISGGEFYEAYEEGLLDLAFSPMFETNGYFYLSYTCQLDDGENQRNRLSKFEYFAGDATATRASEDILLTTAPKFSSIHAAGWVGFKPSDYGSNQAFHDIYWATGDGGAQTDPLNTGQDTTNMLASIMRVSVPSDGTGYEIPSGNLGGSALPEICANGFRNPFRCGFDRATDELYCGDVGHTDVEEIDIVECGKNYGWSRFEGSRCQEAQEDRDGACLDTDRSGYTFPVFEYCHPDYFSNTEDEAQFTGDYDLCGDRLITGHAVIGGYVYRGEYFSDLLEGAYIFGDSTNRNIYFIRQEEGEWQVGSIISDRSVAIISFAEDINGEIMLVTRDYEIYHLPCGDLCATTCLEQAEELPTFTSKGCVTDVSNDRALSIKATTCGVGETAMSAAICSSYCSTVDGAIYAGVQFADECFCGTASDDYDKHGSLPIESCDMMCSATPEEFCGGRDKMEVFELGPMAPSPVPPPSPFLPPTTATPTPVPPTTTIPPSTVPTTTVPPTSVPPTSGSYLGCYADSGSGRIMVKEATQSDMTADVCAGICEGLPYYGTQNGNECWCGNAATDYDQYGETTCTSPCAGDASETCGGRFAMSVYQSEGVFPTPAPVDVTEPTPTPTPAPITVNIDDYLGCYADSNSGRIMVKEATQNDMTSVVCAGICEGLPYYGTQNGNECWCGDAATDYDQYGETTCTSPCDGDSSEICGGRFAMSVYESEGELPPTPAPVDVTVPITPAPTTAEIEGYLGCYADSQAGRIMVMEASQNDMTAAVCQALCDGSPFYGTQFATQCFCGDASTDYDQYGETSCIMECAGESSEICGGRDAMSVYENNGVVAPTPTPTTSSFLGCFADSKTARIMVKEASQSDMTSEVCAELCSGSSFFGTQFGKECWCGDASTDFDQYGEATCSVPCAGDSSETCGGNTVMSVYEY